MAVNINTVTHCEKPDDPNNMVLRKKVTGKLMTTEYRSVCLDRL